MSKLKKGQTITKTTEETAVELDGEMSMDAELIGKFITKQVAVTMADKSKEYEKKEINLRKAEKTECRESRHKKRYEGRWTRLTEKQVIQDSNNHQVWSSTKICVSVGITPTEYPPKPFARKIPTSRRCRQQYARKREKEKSSALQELIKVNIADLEN